MKTLNILNLKKEAHYLHATLSGYRALVERLQNCLVSGTETIDAEVLEEYLYAYRLQRHANRIMPGACLLPLTISRRYDIEEILYAISSLLPPLRDYFYKEYLPEEEGDDSEKGERRSHE